VSWRSATEARSNLTARYSIPGHLVGHLGSSINLAEARVKDLGALRMPPGIPIQCVLGVVDFSVITDLVDVDLFDPFDDQELNKLSPLSIPVQYVDIQVEKFKLFFKFQIGGFKLIFDENSQFFDENALFSLKKTRFLLKKLA
jgi:hypothetical protein